MSKQLRFFMDADDRRNFFEFTHSIGDIIIKRITDNYGNYQCVTSENEIADLKYYIYNPSLRLVISDNFINEVYSDVIEFDPSFYRGENIITAGRLYVITSYYNETRKLIHKDPQIIKKYTIYRNYIHKYYKVSRDGFSYIGPNAHERYKNGWIIGNPNSPEEFD